MKLSFLFILIFANSIFELFSIELECEFRKLKFFPDNLKVISCTFYQTFTEPNTRISKITPEEFHINAIYINGSTINYMPQNLAQFFPDLFYLDVVNCKLLEIHKNDLENFKKLVRLDLSKNKLKIIEKDLFKENTELRYLWLHNNDFKFISAKSFDHLPKLDYINLRHNPCTNRFHRAEKKPQKMMEVLRDSYVSCFDKNHFSDDEKMSELMSETEEFLSQIKNMKNGNRSDQMILDDEKFEEISFIEIYEKFQTCEENLKNEKNLLKIANESFQNCDKKFSDCQSNLTNVGKSLMETLQNSENLNKNLQNYIEKSEKLELQLKKSEEKTTKLTLNLMTCEENSNFCLSKFGQVDQKFQICQQNLTQCEESLKISNLKNYNLESNLKICNENSSKIATELTETSQKLTKSEEKNKNLEKILSKVTKVSLNLEQILTIQNKTVKNLKETLDNLTRTSLQKEQEFKEKLKSKDLQINNMKSQIEKKSKRIESLEEKNENLRFEIHHITARNDAQRNEIENLKNELKMMKNFVNEHFESSKEVLENFFDDARIKEDERDGKTHGKNELLDGKVDQEENTEIETTTEISTSEMTSESQITTQNILNNSDNNNVELNDAYFAPADYHDFILTTYQSKIIHKREIHENTQIEYETDETTESFHDEYGYLEVEDDISTNEDKTTTVKLQTESQTAENSKLSKFQKEFKLKIHEVFGNVKNFKSQSQLNDDKISISSDQLEKLDSALKITQKFSQNLLKTFNLENRKLKEILKDSIMTQNELSNQRDFSNYKLQALDVNFTNFQQKSANEIENLKEINEQQSFDNDVGRFWIIMVAIFVILSLLIICIILMMCYIKSERRYWERELDKNLLSCINYRPSVDEIFTVGERMSYAYDNPVIELAENGVELTQRNDDAVSETMTTVL